MDKRSEAQRIHHAPRPIVAALAALLLAACGSGGGGGNSMDEGANPGGFKFARNALTDYGRVDRMGAPVVATVLLPVEQKDSFNDNDPINDGDYAQFVVPTLEELHFELDDQIRALGMTPCAVDVCVRQAVPQVVPDVLRLRIAEPDGFPNGRRLQDSVVDRIIAVALLDMTTPGDCRGEPCSVDSFVKVPVNPTVNEHPLPADFPYLAAPNPPP